MYTTSDIAIGGMFPSKIFKYLLYEGIPYKFSNKIGQQNYSPLLPALSINSVHVR